MFRLTASVSTYGAKILSTNDDAMMEKEKANWQAIFHTNVRVEVSAAIVRFDHVARLIVNANRSVT
jgi:hypothetical protein